MSTPLDDAERRLREIFDTYAEKLRKLEDELDKLEEKIREKASTGEVVGELRRLRFEARSLLSEFKLERGRALREIRREFAGHISREEFEQLRDKFEELEDELEDRVDELLDRLEDIRDSLAPGGVRREIRIRIPEIKLPDIGRIIEESLSTAWYRAPSTVVSSARISQADLNVIDALVEAGIFRSRNEGIAYFVHRGIECSKDWLERVKAKVEEIRKLQEEVQRELKGAGGGEGGKEGSVRISVE